MDRYAQKSQKGPESKAKNISIPEKINGGVVNPPLLG
jgi:hypothetical protein